MIFVTGDIHGDIDIHKLSSGKFPFGKKLTRDDYLIICGDFGLLWGDSDEEHYWLRWLQRKPWTTLWIDGNHENYDMIQKYPREQWHGGEIQKISENIFHLCRGNMFDIDGRSFFVFGGAESHDIEYRIPGKSWWPQELPTEEEIDFGRTVLENAGWKADYILTHSLPGKIQDSIFGTGLYPKNRLTDFFDEINAKAKFGSWFSGHYHISSIYEEKYCLIFDMIVLVG